MLQQLKVSANDARSEVVSAIGTGNVNTWRVREPFRAAAGAARAVLAEQSLVWAKSYLSSPQFATDYAAWRNERKPQASGAVRSVDDELKARAAKRKADLEEMKKNVAAMPAEYRKQAEEGYRAAVEAMKVFDTPEMREMERQGIEMERSSNKSAYEEKAAKWAADYPAEPRALVKRRLRELLDATANVDFDAKLVSRGGVQRFANAEYEKKPAEWKLAYRAGRETTERVRAFAGAWLAELK